MKMIRKNWDVVSVTSETPVVFLLSCHAIRLTLSIGGSMPLLVFTRSYEATQVQLLAWDEVPFSPSPPNRKSTPGVPLKRSWLV